VKLEAKGLVTIVPRHGVYINDYRSSGSLELLVTLMNYEDRELEPHILESLLDMRAVLEEKIASLAANCATLEDLSLLEETLRLEQASLQKGAQETAQADYQFHHHLALASGNSVYPFIMNSFQPLYTMLLVRFYDNSSHAGELFAYHRRIVDAIMAHDADQATATMRELLSRSRDYLRSTYQP
jgi:GntR family transcriptional repressor for pyruvate dehydrogenase complex